MLTYQDLLEIQDTDEARMDFVRKAINQHREVNNNEIQN